MRTDIYVVQKTAEEGKELEQWCLKNDLPIDCTRFSFIPDWNKFAWHHNGFVKNLKTETSTAVTIEEFKRLQLESLGKTETSQELIMLPDEGCFYGTKEQQTAFARFLCTRPFCRADGKITKDETIGIGWNKTSHWWLKTKTSQKTEYSFEELKGFIKNLEEISYDFKPGDWVKTKSGKSSPFELQEDNFPIKNGLLAGFKVEDLVKCEKPTSDLKIGDYITVTDKNISEKFKMIGKITEVRSDKDKDSIRGNADYISVTKKEFRKTQLWCYKDNRTRTYRKSTQEEIEWLNKCIKAGRFVEKDEKPINFGGLNLEDWLRETKKLNLSKKELAKHLNSPESCKCFEVYDKLKGGNEHEKAEILWNEWNKPEIDKTDFIVSIPDEWGQNKYVIGIDPYKLLEEEFKPNTQATLIPVKQKQIFKN